MNKFIYFPKKSHHGYFDRGLQQWFSSKSEKRTFMNSHGIIEDGSMEKESHRVNRITDEINAHREKQGKKPLTRQEVIGNSREFNEFKIPKQTRR